MTDKQILGKLEELWPKTLDFITKNLSQQKIADILDLNRASVCIKMAGARNQKFSDNQKVAIIKNLYQIKKDLSFL